MMHVYNNIGGVYYTAQNVDEKRGNVYDVVPISLQKEALSFFDKELFTTPYWLLNKNVLSKVGKAEQPDFVEGLQTSLLQSLLSASRMNRLTRVERQFGDKALPVNEYVEILHKIIWKELTANIPINPYRRNLQREYIKSVKIILASANPEMNETDAASILRADMGRLQNEIHAALPRISDMGSKDHLQDMEARIKNILELDGN